ncbi:mannose-6-phosphate isomerase [Planctomycetales bacterium]|nr:mannose-6-phosphate isomerase [Planctomycetales bacterium]
MPDFDFLLQNTPLYPLRFAPVYKNYIWGGTLFGDLFQRELPDNNENYAESWEIADHSHGHSIIKNGILRGIPLNEVVRQVPKALFGSGFPPKHLKGHQPSRFPLILKYLDAQSPLSVQIHPDNKLAEELQLENSGKTEFWVVVAAKPDASLWIGTNQEYPKQEVENAIRSGNVQPLLLRQNVQKDDCFYLPPGTLHSLGEGILVAEIQTSSDTTFRVFDWNRTDKDGKMRELKIEEAILALPEKSTPVKANASVKTISSNCEELIADKHFTVRRWKFDEKLHWNSDDRCHIWTVLEGSVVLRYDYGNTSAEEKLCFGDSVLIPAITPQLDWIPADSALEFGKSAVLLEAAPEI